MARVKIHRNKFGACCLSCNATKSGRGHKRTRAASKERRHSINSSAATSMLCGTVRPIALAVFKLITNSNLIGT